MPDRIRTSAVAFGLRGVITIEAALSVWIFLMMMLSLVSVLQIFETHQLVQRALVNAGTQMSVIGTDQYGTEELYALAAADLAKAELSAHGVAGGMAGVSLIGSQVDGSTGQIMVQANYRVRPAILFIPGIYIHMYNRVSLRLWCGYKGCGSGDGTGYGDSGTVYYVSDYQSVYHSNPNCSHLRLTIRTSDVGTVGQLTNSSGHHYHACGKCGNQSTHGVVYVTPEGDCYHSTLGCSGLNRSIHQVEGTHGLTACSRCGG